MTTNDRVETLQKRTAALRYYLIGARRHLALEAMEFARGYHTGLRKDGVTPEFEHQISIALYVRTLDGVLLHPDETLATVFLHDTREDYDVSDEEIRERFGDLVANAVDRMTKEFRGNRKDPARLFEAMAEDPIASIAKGADRIHNFQSMNAPRPCGRPTFGLEKQKRYIEEARQYFLPMLKVARRRFPCQEAAYENIKHLLKSQIELLEAVHRAAETPSLYVAVSA